MTVRPIQPDDWVFVEEPLSGYIRRDGRNGNPLYAAQDDQRVEPVLEQTLQSMGAQYHGVTLERYHVQMPIWDGPALPAVDDYVFVDAPQRLQTTSISVIMIPDGAIKEASMGYHFDDSVLLSLRERMQAGVFDGVVGNLGYYMTPELIRGKAWAHNARFPDFPLSPKQSYLGFHWTYDRVSGRVSGGFAGAHPAAIAVAQDGVITILPDVPIEGYSIGFGTQTFTVKAINDLSESADIVLFTPALRTPACEQLITQTIQGVGETEGWKTHAPLLTGADRVYLFVANVGDGQMPQECIVALWEGAAPVPSFGGVLSFSRAKFNDLFGSIEHFRATLMNQQVTIVPHSPVDLTQYHHILGGFVPVIIDGQLAWQGKTMPEFLTAMSRTGNALAPIAQAGRESKNFDAFVREPAGVMFRTASSVGWIMFDGRHECSIGASTVDVHLLLQKLAGVGALSQEPITQAFVVDGGSAMKAYWVQSDEKNTTLRLLNRVAGGGRNPPGRDDDGLNLYSTLSLALSQ